MTGDLLKGFTLGDFRVHPPTGTLNGPDGTHHLTPTTMDVLVYLASRRGELVTRQEIVDAVWSGDEVGNTSLTRCIGDLRQHLNDDPERPDYIQTLPRRGYRLLADVAASEQSGSTNTDGDADVHDLTLTEFVAEIRRRRVIRVGLVYIVASWVIIQVAQAVFPALLMPDWTVTLVVALCVLGFPVAIILAWAYQVKPDSGGPDGPSVQLVVDRGRKVDFVIIATLAVGVVILAYELYVRQETGPTPVDPGQETESSEPIADDLAGCNHRAGIVMGHNIGRPDGNIVAAVDLGPLRQVLCKFRSISLQPAKRPADRLLSNRGQIPREFHQVQMK